MAYENLNRDASGLMCKYYFSDRRNFSGRRDLSMAVDAARIGRRMCLLGAIANSDNVMMWAPPQASRYVTEMFVKNQHT